MVAQLFLVVRTSLIAILLMLFSSATTYAEEDIGDSSVDLSTPLFSNDDSASPGGWFDFRYPCYGFTAGQQSGKEGTSLDEPIKKTDRLRTDIANTVETDLPNELELLLAEGLAEPSNVEAIKTEDSPYPKETDLIELSAGLTIEGIPGSHVDAPLAPVGEPREINPGEVHWYRFRDEGDDSTIRAALDAIPDNGIDFEVWTPDQLRKWQIDEEFDPVGQGTENKAVNIDRYWSGSFVRSGQYYIIVRHSGLSAGPVSYSLLVSGDDVSY
ncbi:MAG: hypothetical protein AAF702_31640 [Chloroflexota bacterium]